MSATVEDVNAKLDSAVSNLKKTTSSYSAMVKKYGSDWTKWPKTTNWYLALNSIQLAESEISQLPLQNVTAKFIYKEI